MDTLYVHKFLLNTPRDAYGWPVGLTKEGKDYVTKLAAWLLRNHSSVTLTHFENMLRSGLSAAPTCVQESSFKTAICHRAMLAVDAQECFRASNMTPKA